MHSTIAASENFATILAPSTGPPVSESTNLNFPSTMLAEPATVSEPVSGGSVESSEIQEVLPALAGGDLVKENASVMTVNRKFNFVVVNLGLKDNLKIGSQLAVVRDGKQIGVVQIEKLYDRFAAAAILNEAAKDKIEKGDEIRTL